MIVRDEGKVIEECLRSICWWVDEIVVVDTGSKDDTIEILRSYDCRILEDPWRKDFSYHRNQSIGAASSEWVFIIDADERVHPAYVGELLKAIGTEGADSIEVQVWNMPDNEQGNKTFVPSIRFFRKETGLRYKDPVHNYLVGDLGVLLKMHFPMKHIGYNLDPLSMEKKLARSEEILRDEIRKDPNNTRHLFNLAQLLRSRQHEGDAVLGEITSICSRIRKISDGGTKEAPDYSWLMASSILGWVRFQREQFQEAIEIAMETLAIKPDYIDSLYLRAMSLGRLEKWDEAHMAMFGCLKWYDDFDPTKGDKQKILENTDHQLILMYAGGRTDMMFAIGAIYEKLAEIHEAKGEKMAFNFHTSPNANGLRTDEDDIQLGKQIEHERMNAQNARVEQNRWYREVLKRDPRFEQIHKEEHGTGVSAKDGGADIPEVPGSGGNNDHGEEGVVEPSGKPKHRRSKRSSSGTEQGVAEG